MEVELIGEKEKRSGYSPEIAEQILERICNGELLTEVCKGDNMPTRTAFYGWMRGRDDLRDDYLRSRLAWADYWAERVIQISLNPERSIEAEGKIFVDRDVVAWAKHLTDNLKWLVGKYAPRTYGDKVELLASAGDQQAKLDPINKIELIGVRPEDGAVNGTTIFRWADSVRVVVYPMLRPDGTLIPKDTPEYDAAIEQAANEARKRHADPLTGRRETSVGIDLNLDEQPKPPAQLTYQPEPLPGGLTESDWQIMGDVLRLIKQTIPSDDSSPPETIFRVMKEALLLHFREVDIDASANAA
ncbi:hypothetical protein V1277_006279 [Bradyrhizobium sp. AZCC 1588]|uniref:terminase small subunit-like protein n=1 Tax=unclassified Bradyrhizobium TaxID=2631580 RepID=UPI002FF1B384